MKNNIGILTAVIISAILAVGVQADMAANAKKIQESYKDSVIWVEGVLKAKVSAQGQTRNQDQEVRSLGTIVSKDGLTVVPNSSLNPSGMMAQVMKSMGMSIDASLTDVKLLLPDGEEVSAEVVMKDEDLDLAFLYPSEVEEGEEHPEFTGIDLSKSSKPELLDEMIVLGRMPKFMNREPSISIVRLGCIIEKPRTFYQSNTLSSLGVPIFDKTGNLIGISVIRSAPNLDISSMQDGGMIPVILPAEDVLDIAEQARAEIESRREEN